MTKMERRDRFVVIDLLRGFALSLMIMFHLLWDLDYYGMKPLDKQTYQFTPVTAILFFFVVGISIMLAAEKKTTKQMVIRSLIILMIGCCISVVSLFVLPEKPVYFGMLHCIGISMIIGTALRRLDTWTLLTISLLTIILGMILRMFDVPSSLNFILVVVGAFGLALVLEGDWDLGDTWVSLAFLVWLALGGVVTGILMPNERKLAAGDTSAERLIDRRGQLVTVLVLVMLYLKIWKPGA